MVTSIDLDPLAYYHLCSSPESGAVLQFIGIVRNHTSSPKKVKALFYEAHQKMATDLINNITQAAILKFKLSNAHCIHRIGELSVGGLAIVVTTSGAHRDEVYQANRYIVDRVKYEAPIWKKEIFEDGTSEWGRNSGIKPNFVED